MVMQPPVVVVVLVTALLFLQPQGSTAFVSPQQQQHQQQLLHKQSCRTTTTQPLSVLKMSQAAAAEDANPPAASVLDRSTLSLLEHININVPNHDCILDFYFGVLGCGMDPRKAENVVAGSKTVWANCGGSQFHLPYGDTPQVIPGHVGLRYNDLEGLKTRLLQHDNDNDNDNKCFQEYSIGRDPGSQQEHVRIVDTYGNVFYCRAKPNSSSSLMLRYVQPLVSADDTETWGEIATRYGRESSECRGIDYVEFDCPVGTASKIAQFYETVFDATTSVVVLPNDNNDKEEEDGTSIAVVAFGAVDGSGRADQSLLFRETTEPLPPYDGHHVAMYVGWDQADFEQAFRNAQTAGIVWVNSRFKDDVTDLAGARKFQQFRFKNIIDVPTGQTIMELEHEMRSVQHSAWPGQPP